ncbi:MAG: TRAP transporter substrate-binding protein DctP [Treponema sp.]|nr:TRAP transporter substrate-binding protein DctP [Treponema sp.]
MKKHFIIFVFALFCLLFSLGSVYAQRGSTSTQVTNIRFISSLPRNSDWGRELDKLASDWQRATNNQVRVTMTHGSQMSESTMISSLLSNSIQAAVLSSSGLYEICPAVINLSVPFMIRNDAELDLVLRDIKPVLEDRVRNEFVIIGWSKGGWVYIFSKEAVLTPNDLRRQKLASSNELRDMNTAFKTMGFQVIETDWVNIGTRLASNMVTAFYMIPTLMVPLNLHRGLQMLELPIAPVMGAIVMNRVTWNQISAANQQEMLRFARQMGLGFDASINKNETAAITSMSRDRLTVNRPNQVQQEIWRAELQNSIPSLVGSVYDRDLYNQINGILQRARSGR